MKGIEIFKRIDKAINPANMLDSMTAEDVYRKKNNNDKKVNSNDDNQLGLQQNND